MYPLCVETLNASPTNRAAESVSEASTALTHGRSPATSTRRDMELARQASSRASFLAPASACVSDHHAKCSACSDRDTWAASYVRSRAAYASWNLEVTRLMRQESWPRRA